MSYLPLIVGFGGYNAAGRSSGHQSYQRMILESLSDADRAQTLNSLAQLMGVPDAPEDTVIKGTLVRRIGSEFFDVNKAPVGKEVTLKASKDSPNSFIIATKDLPDFIPDTWQIEPVHTESRYSRVTFSQEEKLLLSAQTTMPVQSAGQLPQGFDPGAHYRSQHHPRGLQMSILGASDAVKSVGIDWQTIADSVSPDAISVYSSSVMSQLDQNGFGGMMGARMRACRATSKQLAMGLNTMPADFINAYVLGSVGATAGVTGACATFLYNLRFAVDEIRSGRRKVAVVGASEAPILPEVMDGYSAMSALATDADLLKLEGLPSGVLPDHRRASRPFGPNCGFTLAESSQYVVLMADDLAMELGAQVFGAVPGVYVNADGYKKSISAPGAGNYITMAKAVALGRSLLGEDAIKHRSFVQAHGSSTPHNRVTESRIFDEVAKGFGIQHWPVAAVKAYLGHSLGPASGDQMAASLGVFAKGILPGIKTIDAVADDIFSSRLNISNKDNELGVDNAAVAFLNSKGFGGNNATATVLSPNVIAGYLEKRHGKASMSSYRNKLSQTTEKSAAYLAEADAGNLNPIYDFGAGLIDEDKIKITADAITIPGYSIPIALGDNEGYSDF